MRAHDRNGKGGTAQAVPPRPPITKGENGEMATITESRTPPGEILARLEEEGIEFIRFWFTDILGQLKSFAVGREEMEGALEDGMGFDGSSITGFNRIEESDMIAMPDPASFRILPWRTGETHKVGRVFCDILKPGGEPY